ncbi:MAG: hypothetical protein HN833_02625 [Elusimicrobiaceae bacterium]|jgi:hypothetical protein|nr:hypothetical protein [Elusimicrobiaceae bacterium]MBT5491943.1 hypothetical protein [bacterium]MBT3955099.1 hypothetical protein [Elusimicrobiaceae bacterium]MBT4008241.1 hypothetical protein [Elusimicrobiaceae bacterium]MBT4402810.1 hypothetical protein [Elusimicrobiaceae bacterium]
MSNIIQKFKEFPLSIKIITVFIVVVIVKLIIFIFFLPYVFTSYINIPSVFIRYTVILVSFCLQLIFLFRRSEKAFIFSLIPIIVILLMLPFVPAEFGYILYDYSVWGIFIGFTFELPFFLVIQPTTLMWGLYFIIIVALEIWKIVKIKKYCTK